MKTWRVSETHMDAQSGDYYGEPDYLVNPCLVCGAPMLGVHYHETEDDDDDQA